MEMLVLLFRITQVKASKKVKQELSTKKRKKMEKRRQKEFSFNNLRMPKCKKSSQQSSLSSLRENCSIAKCFNLLCASESAENLWKEPYASKVKKRRRSGD